MSSWVAPQDMILPVPTVIKVAVWTFFISKKKTKDRYFNNYVAKCQKR